MNPAFKVLHESGGEYKQRVFNVACYEFSCEGRSELILQRYMRLILLGTWIFPLSLLYISCSKNEFVFG